MKAPAFWWSAGPSFVARLLQPASWLYGRVAAFRMGRTGEYPRHPVICIGNLVAGGAGKTPAALATAQILRDLGHKPAFLSRGYGGRLSGPVLVDETGHGAADIGDEPLLLARIAPTIVARDRVAGAAFAAGLHADVLVMDDGLQNPSLVKTLSIAVVDGETGIGNGLCLPGGPLRAPLKAQWPRIDAVLLVGAGQAGEALAGEAIRHGKPVLRAALEAAPDAAATIADRKVLAFAGIGRPEKFFSTLRDLGADIVLTRSFPDHAPLSAADAVQLLGEAKTGDLMLVTTTKDQARMIGRADLAELADAITVLPVTLRLQDKAALSALLEAALKR